MLGDLRVDIGSILLGPQQPREGVKTLCNGLFCRPRLALAVRHEQVVEFAPIGGLLEVLAQLVRHDAALPKRSHHRNAAVDQVPDIRELLQDALDAAFVDTRAQIGAVPCEKRG